MSKQPLPASAANTSNISVFLTNLRLLDFDKRSDWPSITIQTFPVKDAQQNQKNRIRCVEWALYRLFEEWDPEETKNKLQPFFPPILPLQSLNLRAALFRSLNQLKKDGILGKDVTIRKTMLDECKGDKLEEVLVAFSTVVLQKLVAAEQHGEINTVRRLAIMPTLSVEEQKSLLPLAVAHRASLINILREKSKLRSRYQEFHRLLDIKDEELSRKKEASKILYKGSGDIVGNINEIQEIKQQFEIHWQGDPGWKDILLIGDKQDLHDPLLDLPFSEVRRHVVDGTLLNMETVGHQSLVQDLDMRVKSQAARLERWRSFRKESTVSAKTSSDSSHCETRLGDSINSNLNFTRHEDLNFDPEALPHKFQKKSRPHGGSVLSMIDGYERLISSMRSNISSVDQPMESALSQQIDSETRDTILEDNEQTPLKIPNRALSNTSKEISNDPRLPADNRTHLRKANKKNDEGILAKSASESPLSLKIPTLHPLGTEIRDSTQLNSVEKNTEANTISTDEKEIIAEQIKGLATDARVSPTKSKLSLTERTRKSMALANPEDVYRTTTQIPLPATDPGSTPAAIFDGRETLLERTRQSMSLLPTKSRPSRRSFYPQTLKSYPTNQFETPEKSRPGVTETSTPPEELFSQDANYASVFKSRPKIALSPTLSPVIDGPKELTNLMDSYFGEDDHSMQLGSSPLSGFTSKVGHS